MGFSRSFMIMLFFPVFACAGDLESIPWKSVELPVGCKNIDGIFSPSGDVIGGDFSPGENKNIYENVFPFPAVNTPPSSVAIKYHEDLKGFSIRLLDQQGETLIAKNFSLPYKCDAPWLAYSLSSSGGGDGSSVSNVEETTKLAVANDGSLIVLNVYRITRSSWMFFSKEESIVTWYRFKSATRSGNK